LKTEELGCGIDDDFIISSQKLYFLDCFGYLYLNE